jgi:glycerate kinase
MKIVVAPQAFKESLTARDAADAIARGVLRALPAAEVVLRPMADGGDGTLDALLAANGCTHREAIVTGPLAQPVTARWGVLNDGRTAVVEAAQACGLALAPDDQRNPARATSRGLGELIRAALDAGLRRILIGVGGTATVDGGAGMAQALGARLLDASGHDLPPGGAALTTLARMDLTGLDLRLQESELLVALDVDNPLCGPLGAVRTYGRQKLPRALQTTSEATAILETLDFALARLGHSLHTTAGINTAAFPGAGAGGGLGAGLAGFLGARLLPGAALVADAIALDDALEGADLAITGEGRLDWQTAYGKAPLEVARRAAVRGIPCIAVCGSLGQGWERLLGNPFTRIAAITGSGVTESEARRNAQLLLEEAIAQALQALLPQRSS